MIGVIAVFIAIPIVALIANAIEDSNKSIPFDSVYESSGLPIVALTNNGQTFNFLVDTGANMSILNEPFLDKVLYTNVEGQGTLFGMEGNLQLVEYVEVELKHGRRKFNIEFQVVDLGNAFGRIEKEHNIQLCGVLGTTFLEQNKGRIDFIEHQLKYGKAKVEEN